MDKKKPIIESSEALVKVDKAIAPNSVGAIDEAVLFEQVATIIENRKSRAGAYANREVTLMYWEVGQYINSVVLDGERAEYGKRIVSKLSTQLVEQYGKVFTTRNLRRMVQFSELFPDIEIVSPLATQLSWSHFIELLPLESDEARLYYANDAAQRRLGKRELRHQISRKAYERREIANANITAPSSAPFNIFKDPYLLDILNLKENFLEADLENAILVELEAFILEFGHGFTFVERQKRMIIDGNDIVLDLLFYHRKLKRLVAVELKIGVFKATYMGQMLLYLKWLNKYEKQPGEDEPLGLILCTKANREQIELLELNKSGIAVAEYWTDLPPKAMLEEKLRTILAEAQERLERRKSLPSGEVQKPINYFYEPKGDEDE